MTRHKSSTTPPAPTLALDAIRTREPTVVIDNEPIADGYWRFSFNWHASLRPAQRQAELFHLTYNTFVRLAAWGTPHANDFGSTEEAAKLQALFKCLAAQGENAVFSFIEALKREALALECGDIMSDELLNFLANGFDPVKGFSDAKKWKQLGRITAGIYSCVLRLDAAASMPAAPTPTPDWPTVTDAAKRADTDKSNITRAIDATPPKIIACGKGFGRRIDPVSLNAWIIANPKICKFHRLARKPNNKSLKATADPKEAFCKQERTEEIRSKFDL